MMTPFFDFFATKIALASGVDFHRGKFPAGAQNNGTAMLSRVGGRPDDDNPNMRWKRFQFLTRNESYGPGEVEAFRIFEIVIRLRGETATGWKLFDVTGTEPAYIGEDEKGRHMFSANVTVSARKD